MKKKVWIGLAVSAVLIASSILLWWMCSRPGTTAEQVSSVSSAPPSPASALINPSPVPPNLEEGSYLLNLRTDVLTKSVSKEMEQADPSNFSYGSVLDHCLDLVVEELWRMEVTAQEPHCYRIDMELVQEGMQGEDGDWVNSKPFLSQPFAFVLNENGSLAWEDEEAQDPAEPLPQRARNLLTHALSGAQYNGLDAQWESFPFFEAWDEAFDLRARYRSQNTADAIVIGIDYTGQLTEQNVSRMAQLTQSGSMLPEDFPGCAEELFYGGCSQADLQARASGSMTADKENALLSSTDLTYSRQGHLIIPLEEYDFEVFQRLDISSQIHYMLEVEPLSEEGYDTLDLDV